MAVLREGILHFVAHHAVVVHIFAIGIGLKEVVHDLKCLRAVVVVGVDDAEVLINDIPCSEDSVSCSPGFGPAFGNGEALRDIVERTKIMHHEGAIAYTEDDGETWIEVPEGTTVSMNFWGFTPSILKEMEAGLPAFLTDALANNPAKGEYLLPKCVDELIKADRAQAKVLKSHDRWYGVTYKEDKEGVVNALQALKDKGLYPQELWG